MWYGVRGDRRDISKPVIGVRLRVAGFTRAHEPACRIIDIAVGANRFDVTSAVVGILTRTPCRRGQYLRSMNARRTRRRFRLRRLTALPNSGNRLYVTYKAHLPT